jgi:hypothetical protein
MFAGHMFLAGFGQLLVSVSRNGKCFGKPAYLCLSRWHQLISDLLIRRDATESQPETTAAALGRIYVESFVQCLNSAFGRK